jgi:hypothetical protein
MTLRFSHEDVMRANDEWGCNCGPSALAAIAGLSLDEVRPLMGDFERKRYTNPTLMRECLERTGVQFKWNTPELPSYGLCRVQWEGPWTRPGVPMRVRYRHTHWIGFQNRPDGSTFGKSGVFDINAMSSGGWVGYQDWATTIVPWILGECEPNADGKWHFTHFVSVSSNHETRK